MKLIYLISVFLHIISAVIWLGGSLFLAIVIVPLIRNPEFKGLSAKMVHWLGIRFRYVGWICLAMLIITGIANLEFRGYKISGMFDGSLWQGYFGNILAVKLGVFGIILILSAVHDFYIGPKATATWQHEPDSVAAKKLRKQASWIGRINLLLGLAIVFMAIMLVRGFPW